jgi:hypothetical protein
LGLCGVVSGIILPIIILPEVWLDEVHEEGTRMIDEMSWKAEVDGHPVNAN